MTKSCYQWQFQEPKLQVPTIYKAYFSGLREYPSNILPYMVLTYLHVMVGSHCRQVPKRLSRHAAEAAWAGALLQVLGHRIGQSDTEAGNGG